MDKLVKRVQRLRIGDPMDEQTEIGPLINGTQLKLCLDYVNQAKQQDGIQLVCGGGDGYRGYYLSPTSTFAAQQHMLYHIFSYVLYFGGLQYWQMCRITVDWHAKKYSDRF